MKAIAILIFFVLITFSLFSQDIEIHKMKKNETHHLMVNETYTSDAVINLKGKTVPISSLSVSGKVKLIDNTSLIRIILVTEQHEYLVYEAFSLICADYDFNINKVCDETDLIENITPSEIIIIVKNAEFELKRIHFSNEKLNKYENDEYQKLKLTQKKLVEKSKANKINHFNYKNNKTWFADTSEISLLPFEVKKTLFCDFNDFQSGGFEYYYDGIFSFPDFLPKKKNDTNLKSIETTTFVSEFDWRNRHSKNWITSVKNQTYECGSCWAHTACAVTEAMFNIYYNNPNIDLDLSEQELVSCPGGGGGCSGGFTNTAMEYIRDNGVVSENCFPYVALDESDDHDCSYKCSSPSEIVHLSSVQSISNTESLLKDALINIGPIGSGICNSDCCHAMALIGYKELEAGDVIRYITHTDCSIDSVIEAGNPLIGQLCWIFKNSYGTNWNGGGTGGYAYVFFDNPSDILGGDIGLIPTSNLNYNRLCSDSDNDGYYWWGTGSKPSSCPSCSPEASDGDDSNANLGPIDAFGNIQQISSPYEPDHEITNTVVWQNGEEICGNVIVKSGGNLTLNNASINIYSEFSVELGGTLTINEGIIQ